MEAKQIEEYTILHHMGTDSLQRILKSSTKSNKHRGMCPADAAGPLLLITSVLNRWISHNGGRLQ